MNDKVGIVVVTYNRKELLKECIESILKQDYQDFVLLVVDNHSTDDTKNYVKGLIDNKKVYFKELEENIGGAGGFNAGMKEILSYDPKYIWIMDDDCMVHNDSLSHLVEAAHQLKDNFGYLSSVVRWKDDDICKMNVQKVSYTKKVEDFSKNQQIQFATFVSFFTKAETVKEVGLPIKEFFIWGDDLEYSSRISKKYPSYLISSSVVTHKSAKNNGSNIVLDDHQNIARYRYAYRNEQYLYRKLGLKARLFYFLKKRLHLLKLRKSKLEDKKERIGIVKNAIKEGKKFNPSIEYVK